MSSRGSRPRTRGASSDFPQIRPYNSCDPQGLPNRRDFTPVSLTILKNVHLPDLDVTREVVLYSRKRHEMPVVETGAPFALLQTGIAPSIGFSISSTGLGARHIMHSGNLIVEAWEIV